MRRNSEEQEVGIIMGGNLDDVKIEKDNAQKRSFSPILIVTVGKREESPEEHVEYVEEIYNVLNGVLGVPFIVCSAAIDITCLESL